MGLYGEAAVIATLYLRDRSAASPSDAWRAAITSLTTSSISRAKSCPRHAFIGLCYAGVVRGCPVAESAGHPTGKNAGYALDCYRALLTNPALGADQRALRAQVTGLVSNQQLDVVRALWDAGLLEGSP